MTEAPLTPSSCDLRGYEWMPLFGERLFSSNFEAHASDLAFRVAVRLYWECWRQLPAASLPNDDVQLCRLAGLGRDMKTWRKLRADGVLHGFRLCSDDRLYHGMLAEEALKAWQMRQRQQVERDYERDKKRRQRGSNTNGADVNDAEHVPRDKARCPPGHPPGQTAMSPGTNGGTNPLVPRDVPLARGLGQWTVRQEKKEDSNLTCFIPPNSAREASGEQEPEEPEPTEGEVMERRQAFAEELTRHAPDIAAHVRRAANASRMHAPLGEVRSADAQLDAMAAQPAVVGADVSMGLRWAPAEPVRTVAEQLVILRGA